MAQIKKINIKGVEYDLAGSGNITADTAYVDNKTLYIEEGTTAGGGGGGPVELNGIVVDTLEDDFKLFKTIILEIKLSENEEELAKFFLNNLNWKVNFEAEGEKGYLLPFENGTQFVAMSETSGIVGTGYVIASIHDGVRFVICNNVLIEISKTQDNVFTALDKMLFSSIVRASNIAVAFGETIYSVYGSTISSIQDYFQSNPIITNTNIMKQLELHFDDNSGIVEYEELKFTLTRAS